MRSVPPLGSGTGLADVAAVGGAQLLDGADHRSGRPADVVHPALVLVELLHDHQRDHRVGVRERGDRVRIRDEHRRVEHHPRGGGGLGRAGARLVGEKVSQVGAPEVVEETVGARVIGSGGEPGLRRHGGVGSPLGHRRSVNPTARVGWGMVDGPVADTVRTRGRGDDRGGRSGATTTPSGASAPTRPSSTSASTPASRSTPRCPLPADDLRAPAGCFLVAYRDGEAIGCGGLKLHGTDPAEIKRVWVDRAARGLGLARRLLTELEDRARAAGAPAVQLDTNRTLTEAIALYRKTGYVEIDAFNDEPYAHHWFRKDL